MIEESIEEKINLIKEYISEKECEYMTDDLLFDCNSCSCFEDCYMKSCEKCNSEFAESINYGGYNTEEDFWEQI